MTQANPRTEAAMARLARIPRPWLLIAMPFLLLCAHVIGGPPALVLVALAFPLGLAFAPPPPAARTRDRLTGLALRPQIVAALDASLRSVRRQDLTTAVLVMEIDSFRLLEERHDNTTIELLLSTTADRLRHLLRDTDVAGRLEGGVFVAALAPVRRLELEATIQLAGRLQHGLSQPIRVDSLALHPTVSIGFVLCHRLEDPTGETMLRAACLAMREAQRSGPGAIRSFSDSLRARVHSRNNLADEVAGALDRGEITAFFQPQIETATGRVSGCEALARWHHPTRGLIPPAEFLPVMEQAGMLARLGEVMLHAGLSALQRWDGEGLVVPRIGVNFSPFELSDPRLTDRIMWELDRFDLAPERLVIEVLETVVAARSGDMVMQNLAGLARLGCRLDLDDFGTGSASITSIRRFAIERIKIDRSFVTGIDADPEQQKMVSAILTMADRLGLDTLAEGVETEGERNMLTTLGCGHLQGFGIARPMPMPQIEDWLRATRDRANGDGVLRLPRRA
jgi:diguanylate cyclase (GGDEF)-like protein